MINILKNAVYYSTDRVSVDKLNFSSYVSTENLIQNKLGKTDADKLPSQNGKVTGFIENDILVSNIRPYLKKIWYANISGGSSTDVLTFRVKDTYIPKFVYYTLFRDEFFQHMMNGSKGTKMPRGDKTQILNFPIPFFEKNEQKKIAKVLSLLDKKIELNNKINTELEAMAKLIYDYWFVQFDFPDANGKPYKSSGGKMVYNEVLKREIPLGWEDKELSEIANITMGQSPSGTSYNDIGEGTIFFQGSTDFGYRFPSIRQYTTKPSRLAKSGNILLSVRAPVGTLNIADNDCCIGRGLAALDSKQSVNSFLFYAMMNLKQVFDRRNTAGTTFGSITKDDLFSLKLVYPTTEILIEYDKKIAVFNKRILNNHRQNQEMIEIRDWLLPMLMSGQVTVKDA